MYNTNSQIRFKFVTLRDYSDEYLLVKETIIVTLSLGKEQTKKFRKSKELILENCASFSKCINEIAIHIMPNSLIL